MGFAFSLYCLIFFFMVVNNVIRTDLSFSISEFCVLLVLLCFFSSDN